MPGALHHILETIDSLSSQTNSPVRVFEYITTETMIKRWLGLFGQLKVVFK
jgi:hypothetical protein